MRVLRAYFSLPPLPGGMEQHVHELSNQQRKLGVEVIQVCSQGDLNRGQGFQVLRGWPILHIRPRALRDLLFHGAAAIGARRRRIHVDVVHIHGDWSAFLFGRILKRVTRARLLVGSVHGHVPESRWRRAAFRASVRPYQVLHATGSRERDLLTQWSGKAWCWTASGIDEHFFEVDAGGGKTNDVAIVGSMVPVKGLDLVLQVARLMPACRFRFIGDGPERSRLELQARRDGMSNLRFEGRLSTPEVAAALAGSRSLLITSHTEGTPTAMLEAMAVGLPIITTSSNNYSALLGAEEGGVIVESRDPETLARALGRFIADENLARKTGERNRRVAAEYAWPNVAERVTRSMQEALEQTTRA